MGVGERGARCSSVDFNVGVAVVIGETAGIGSDERISADEERDPNTARSVPVTASNPDPRAAQSMNCFSQSESWKAVATSSMT
ncbi:MULTISPECIES: hypothetical protein [Nocardia]|uniref:hypothetical protein n=1 Tax=Nocardia TaxID=1817 RepID=UPI000FDA2CDC|nr:MULTISPECIES: hypothetical protein [Nocardia]MBF6184865.1 hypothetical protein [Nocardia farcinica]MBF6310709.1 hypothetical protein [Nocardia farcinica]MBF6405471.1 hypothetical protein [Nocardia farcinica]UEX24697.1 hypothetical protein LMJ57_09700 [Nocardia farcinica]